MLFYFAGRTHAELGARRGCSIPHVEQKIPHVEFLFFLHYGLRAHESAKIKALKLFTRLAWNLQYKISE